MLFGYFIKNSAGVKMETSARIRTKDDSTAKESTGSETCLDGARMPTENPPFTLKDLKDAVPPHCFERSLLTSSLYLLLDLTGVFVLYAAAFWVFNASLPVYVHAVFWPLYWLCQGCVGFSVWIIAHECGHYSFCNSKRICDVVGLILHTALFVPYHSWRISHAKHHRNTNRMDGDQAFIPNTRSFLKSENELEFPNIFFRVLHIVKYLTIGWPAYLFFHARGRPYKEYRLRPNHFNPYAPIFSAGDFWDVIVSDVALLVWIGILFYLSAHVYSFGWLVCLYVVPLMNVNMWLVIVTYLQHSDVRVPHYADEEWTWLKGALCTIDRDYGILNYVFHHLTDCHVAHHLFSYMPHYHMAEATEAIKPILGRHYAYDGTPFWKALWNTDSYCRFVEDGGKILWYKFLPEH